MPKQSTNICTRLLTVLLLTAAGSALANNITISDAFNGNGPQMAASPASCNGVESQAYQEIGTITVSFSDEYELADAGNVPGFWSTGTGIVDVVVSVYENSFDANNPELNRIALIDEGDALDLEFDKSYVLVVQPYCENISGVFGVVIRGAGTVSGAGFASPAHTYGDHQGNPVADFPGGIGTRAYEASAAMQVENAGLYRLGDVGINFSADLALLVYHNSFDAQNTSTNLLETVVFDGVVYLEPGQDYVFVAVDRFGLEGPWQYTLFPPGPVYVNESFRGTWTTPGVNGQGVLLEVGRQTGILFFAWFTYPDTLAASVQSGTSIKQLIGSDDQRWLTGFGLIGDKSSDIAVQFENSTGGAFNEAMPEPQTDSSYGSGTVNIVSCEEILISYELPGGVVGDAQMFRTLVDSQQQCLESVQAAVLQP